MRAGPLRSDYAAEVADAERSHRTCPRAWALLSKCHEAEGELLRSWNARDRAWRTRKMDLDLLMLAVGDLTSRARDVNDEEAGMVEAKLRSILGTAA